MHVLRTVQSLFDMPLHVSYPSTKCRRSATQAFTRRLHHLCLYTEEDKVVMYMYVKMVGGAKTGLPTFWVCSVFLMLCACAKFWMPSVILLLQVLFSYTCMHVKRSFTSKDR